MMTRWQGMAMVAAVMLAAGCQAAVHQVKMDRVDQDLAGGNRGYLVGKPPAEGERNATRDLTELEVQLPSHQPPSGARAAAPAAAPVEEASAPAAAEEMAPSSDSTPAPSTVVAPSAEAMTSAAAPVKTYTVRKGDSLSRIAKKVYGNGRLWQRIYDANRDQLPNANKLRPGMVLQIPALDGTAAHHAHRKHRRAHGAATGPSSK